MKESRTYLDKLKFTQDKLSESVLRVSNEEILEEVDELEKEELENFLKNLLIEIRKKI